MYLYRNCIECICIKIISCTYKLCTRSITLYVCSFHLYLMTFSIHFKRCFDIWLLKKQPKCFTWKENTKSTAANVCQIISARKKFESWKRRLLRIYSNTFGWIKSALESVSEHLLSFDQFVLCMWPENSRLTGNKWTGVLSKIKKNTSTGLG